MAGKLPVVFAPLAVRKSLYLKLRTWISGQLFKPENLIRIRNTPRW